MNSLTTTWFAVNKHVKPSWSFWLGFHSDVDGHNSGPHSPGQAALFAKLLLMEISSQGPHTVCFITRQVTEHGAVLRYLSELSKPVPSGIFWVATISSAGTHEAGFGDQWCKQKGWIWWIHSSIFLYATGIPVSEVVFVLQLENICPRCTSLKCQLFSRFTRNWVFKWANFCLRNSVWLEEKCWISMNPSFALFLLNRELALFDLFLQNNVDKTLIYLCIWDVSVSLQQQYQHIFKYNLSILCPKNNAITLCWLFCSNVIESDCKAILTQIICQFGFYYKN